jgi:hypothetical protein
MNCLCPHKAAAGCQCSQTQVKAQFGLLCCAQSVWMLLITDCYRPRLSPLMLLVQVRAAADRGTAAAQALQCSWNVCLSI